MFVNTFKLCKVHHKLINNYWYAYFSAVNGDKDPEDFEGMTPAHCASKYDSFKHLTILYEGTLVNHELLE
jgi:hypothetical protein